MKRILAIAAVAVVATAGGAVAGHWLLGNNDLAGVANAAPADSNSAVNQLWAAKVTNADGAPQSLAGFKGHPVVINFWASWCGPCKMFAPVFDRAAERNTDIVFGKVDTEAQPELAAALGISSIPTLMVLRDGVVLYAEAGARPEAALDELITQVRGLDMDEVRRDITERPTARESA